MGLTYRVFDCIEAVDAADWGRVRARCGEPITADPRFIAAVEASMRPACSFWHVIVYDESGEPVASASLSAITYDMADFADPRLATIVRRLPNALSRLRNLKVLVCGLPGSAGQHSLAIVSPSRSGPVLALLEHLICEMAEARSMNGIVYQEFAERDLEWTKSLLDLGYTRIPTSPMHFFTPSFRDFQDYCEALKSRYRKQISRSTRKLAPAGIRASVLTDPHEMLKAYTPEVHDLYNQVIDRAEVKPERLPMAFFHELARRLAGDLDLIVLSRDAKILAFGFGLHAGSDYHLLFDGLDYARNGEADLYFNLMYAGLDRALRKRVSRIHVGQ